MQTAASVDRVAADLGIVGKGADQRKRHAVERTLYRKWYEVRRRGEYLVAGDPGEAPVVDPETGEVFDRASLNGLRASYP